MPEKITGYRELSEKEINLINEFKAKAEEVGQLVKQLKITEGLDQRWVAIGSTQIQQGFMAVIRGIAQPQTY